MDLHRAVSPVIQSINTDTPAKLYKSAGYTTGPNGRQVAKYATFIRGKIQVQAMSGSALQHANNLNITGVMRQVYMRGDWESIVRSTMKGGDKFVFSHAGIIDGTWLVGTVMETWPTWCKVIVVLQVNP